MTPAQDCMSVRVVMGFSRILYFRLAGVFITGNVAFRP